MKTTRTAFWFSLAVLILGLVGSRLCAAAELPAGAWDKLPPHPRLYANAARWTALKQQVRDDPVSRQLYARVRSDAEEFLTAPPVAYVDTGAFMLGPMQQGQRRILSLAFCFRIEGDRRFLDRAKQEMKALAALPNWYEIHFLDTGEAAMGMGVGFDWLHDELTPDERTEFSNAIATKGLKVSWPSDGSVPKWTTANTNWNQVCHGGLTVGSLAIAEREPALARKTVERAVANLHYAAESYAPGGAYPEGPGYWTYGTTFHVILTEAIRSVFGTSCDLEKFPGFLQSPDFVAQMSGPTGQIFNYADAGAGKRGFSTVMFWFARELGRPDLIETDLATLSRWQEDLAAGKKPGGDRHLALALLVWDPKLASNTSKPARPLAWSSGGGIQPVAAMRSSWTDPRATFVAFKGGLMPNSHAHMDVGTFVLDAAGVRWAIDPGAESYPKVRGNGLTNLELFDTRTQDSKRWWIFRKGPDGHNILRFDGGLQDVDGKAEITPARFPAGTAAYLIELSSLYKRPARSVRRGVALLADQRVLIQDEWTAADRDTTVTWQWLTRAAATVEGNGLVLREAGETLRLRVLSPENARISVEDVSQPRKPFDSPNPGLSRIVVTVPTLRGASGRIAVVAEPAAVAAAPAAVPLRPLAEWTR